MTKGYEGPKIYSGEGSEDIVFVESSDGTSFEEWDTHPEHKRAKADVFASYDVAVARVFERHLKEATQ